MLWRPEEHEPLIDQEWDPGIAREAITEIVADVEAAAEDSTWPNHPLDEVPDEARFCSLYFGGAGMVWGLHRLGSNLDLPAAIAAALERYRTAPAGEESTHAPSLLLGETGILVVAQKLCAPIADERRLSDLVRANREHQTWELLRGSPGTMIPARACGLEREWQESAALLYDHWDPDCDTWTHDLDGDIWPFIGAGHGSASNVHALRGFVDDDILKTRTASLLTRTAHREDGLVNWPPVDRPWSEQEPKIRVQWCHGAPGIIITLADLMPPEMAIAGGELIWRAGPLRKGPGLCHGTAGNGFAFLKLYELTSDELWLDRGRRFAMHAIGQVARHKQRYGRGRYTLWTGDIGAALYVQACLDADPAFPITDKL